jgi:hypothetical protein
MFLCYIDESGTPEIPGNTSHFILAGISIPIDKWKECDRQVNIIKVKYRLSGAEIHTGWMLRKYIEQHRIKDFESLDKHQRIYEVEKIRKSEILRLQRSQNKKVYKQTKKTYKSTNPYIHLTFDERKAFIKEVSLCISKWAFAKLFAECVDKVHFDPVRAPHNIYTQAFEQVVNRFEKYLQVKHKLGLLIHDHNETVAKKHTELMREFHRQGTSWLLQINQIIETPLFVDSQLTSMIQIADLCSYALRRYVENNENELFDIIFKRADRIRQIVVGVRHFTGPECRCKICTAHRREPEILQT